MTGSLFLFWYAPQAFWTLGSGLRALYPTISVERIWRFVSGASEFARVAGLCWWNEGISKKEPVTGYCRDVGA